MWSLWLVFERWQVRLSVGTSNTLNDIFREFSNSLRVSAWTRSALRHLPDASYPIHVYFPIHVYLLVKSYNSTLYRQRYWERHYNMCNWKINRLIVSVLYSVWAPLVIRHAFYLSQLLPRVFQRVSARLIVCAASIFYLAVTSLLGYKVKTTPALVYI
jgi:hypothetical protein